MLPGYQDSGEILYSCPIGGRRWLSRFQPYSTLPISSLQKKRIQKECTWYVHTSARLGCSSSSSAAPATASEIDEEEEKKTKALPLAGWRLTPVGAQAG
ncbi:hypothetical protein BDA96_04G073900 [Sorghum bicolor]|uniref:Uncharacterized protein n=2 Tax=Sorghum bicolor TaxID=4558 RepID=A0A921UHP4_SORBI|nr:hypothetical protein BDA96_04G073900 [Sorghum bicolor]OQU84507.1 hypothetical protein SORBI_3004G068350 [Sorghum bicolor]